MLFLDKITVLILTYNEIENITRTLDALQKFERIIIVDSGSNDGTADIAAHYANVTMIFRSFDSHAAQWNFGLSLVGDQTPWVLALDADYVVNPNLIDEISKLDPSENTSGFRIAFRYCVFGTPLSSALYPSVIALYRLNRTEYVQTGHTQRAIVSGEILELRGRINHDDRKPIQRWFDSQRKYAKLEAEHLRTLSWKELRLTDKIRRTALLGPPFVFLYTLFIKGVFINGWAGWYYLLQRVIAECLIAIELLDSRLRTRIKK